jgi:DnaK suppressor protein
VTGRRESASAVSVKAKPVKAAGAVARPKTPSRTVVAPLPKSAPKPNGNGSHKAVASKPAVAIKPAPTKASVPVKAAAPVKTRSAESRKAELPPPRPIPEAVPTNGKPRKNQAGLSPKELEHFRDLLLEKRRELVGDMYSMESEALRTSGGTNLSSLPLHMADMGTDNYEQEFTLGLVEKDRNLLREINHALAKILNGTYGICEGTGKPISKARLEAQPWARFSIEYARSLERGPIRH